MAPSSSSPLQAGDVGLTARSQKVAPSGARSPRTAVETRAQDPGHRCSCSGSGVADPDAKGSPGGSDYLRTFLQAPHPVETEAQARAEAQARHHLEPLSPAPTRSARGESPCACAARPLPYCPAGGAPCLGPFRSCRRSLASPIGIFIFFMLALWIATVTVHYKMGKMKGGKVSEASFWGTSPQKNPELG